MKHSALELCQIYCDLIKSIEENFTPVRVTLGELDKARAEIHIKIVEALGLEYTHCIGITDCLNEFNYNPKILLEKLITSKNTSKS